MLRLFISFYFMLAICVVGFQFLGEAFEEMYLQDWMNYDRKNDYIGAFHFINELHTRLDGSAFQKVLDDFPEDSNIPIEMFDIDQLQISKKGMELLKLGDIYVEDTNKDILYYKLKGSNRVIRLGPMHTYEKIEKANSWYNSVFFVLLGLAVFLWILNLQFKLRRLDKAASVLGEGDFSVRVSEKGRQKIGRLNHSFNIMAERIDKLIKGHKHLTNAVAHELRTPVARLRFQLDMMHEETDQKQRNEYMYGMSDDLNELSDLVDEMLTYARFDREDANLQLSSHSLHQSILRVINARHFQTDLEVQYDESWCQGDEAKQLVPYEPKHLERAIGNLVSNAQKYTSHKIRIEIRKHKSHCTIYIDDDGEGIPEEARQKIFHPFNRLDDSRTRSTGGYGLGLAIVKQIAHLHGGEVTVETSPLGGARFVFSWPITHRIG